MMGYFNLTQKLRLARSLATKASPAYVQYYVTGRCNMACEQCNIIYATAGNKEMNINQIRAVSENFAKIGVATVLLIGGEPFMRNDISEIVRAFTENDIHVRMQTNGSASEEALERCVAAGGHDISVSLDTLQESLQDAINGDMPDSWRRALRTVSIINRIFPENGTGFFGTVLMPRNMEHVIDVLEFATKIGWGMSLVPLHMTSPDRPLGFRIMDDMYRYRFLEEMYGRGREIIDELKQLRRNGMALYDSDEYLDDIYRFITGKPIRWRKRNGGMCDSPSLYFALDPEGSVNPCCDYKLDTIFPAYHPEFPKWYQEQKIHQEVYRYTSRCEGCMYGSYPEITISSRYLGPMLDRLAFFNFKTNNRFKKLTETELFDLARDILGRNEKRRTERGNSG